MLDRSRGSLRAGARPGDRPPARRFPETRGRPTLLTVVTVTFVSSGGRPDLTVEVIGPEALLDVCDEAANVAHPVTALQAEAASQGIDVLVGPEGGFAEEERSFLLRQPRTLRLSLGPRILRADTAAVAALALVQTVLGDWTGPRA